MKALKVHPHRVCWIGKSAVGERIAGQQITVFIVIKGFGDIKNWDQCRSNQESRYAHENDGKVFSSRYPEELSLQPKKSRRRCAASTRPQDHCTCRKHQDKFDDLDRISDQELREDRHE